MMTKNSKKLPIFTQKMSLKTTSGEFLGMYELDFSCLSILHQLWAHMTYFKGKKVRLIFQPIFTLFSPPGRLPKAIKTSWKCLLRVPWWNTFQWGPKKPPKPFLAIKNSSPKILNHIPSPLCIVELMTITWLCPLTWARFANDLYFLSCGSCYN